MKSVRELSLGAGFLLIASSGLFTSSCSTLLEFDEAYVLGEPGSGGTAGGGGAATSCDDGEQDNDGDGNCTPACDQDTCSGHGTCDDSSGTTACTCDPRFSGDTCADCADGYTGDDCVACDTGFQDRNDDGTCTPACTPESCLNDGICDDASGTLTCNCLPENGGEDCSDTCASGTAGNMCDFRLIFALDIPETSMSWSDPADVPYAIDDSATAGAYDRVAYRLVLDDEQVWVEMDPVTDVAAELGVPMDVIFQQPVTNVTVRSFSSNLTSSLTPTTGNVEMWSDCYNEGPDGDFDDDDALNDMQPDCYGSMQVHVNMSTVFAFNRFSSNGTLDLGIGPSPTGNPDYTFRQNADDYTTRRLEVYVR